MDLSCCLNQVLKMRARQKVSEVNKLAMVLVLDLLNTNEKNLVSIGEAETKAYEWR